MSEQRHIDPAENGPPGPGTEPGTRPWADRGPAGLFRSIHRWVVGGQGAARLSGLSRKGIKALGRLGAGMLVKLGGVIWRHPAPAFGTGLAGLAVAILSLAPSANGYLATGPQATGEYRADLECLALNIYHEARGESRFGKFAVGHVVINRVRDPKFPDNICAVVKQGGEAPLNRCQFSWWCDGRSDLPRDARAWQESQVLASLVYSGRSKDPTEGALWYHADFVDPAWHATMTEGYTIGRHIFYHPK